MPVSQVFAAKPSLRPALAKALDGLHALIEKCQSSGPVSDFEAVEREVSEVTMAVGREIIAAELARLDEDVPVVEIDGEPARQVIRKPRRYFTSMGSIEVTRSRYRLRGSTETVCPMELRAGILGERWTPLAAKQACWAVAHLTPSEAEDLFRLLGGMSPSSSSLDRLPKRVGERWEADREDFEELVREDEHVPDEAVAVAVSLDGVMMAMNDDTPSTCAREDRHGRSGQRPGTWREASCGSISFFDEDGERLETKRFGRMPEAKKRALKSMLTQELGRALAERPDLTVVKIADGALDNWDYLSGEIPGGVEAIDFYHAAEHLRAALENAYGEGSREARQQYEKLRLKLRDDPGGVAKVIRALVHLTGRFPGKRKLAGELKYFRRNRHRMNYAALLEANLPIGSGVVEAACKTLVTQRLKRSGMRWSECGGQAILTLRSLIQSDRFESAWEVLVSTYRRDVRVPDGVLSFPSRRGAGAVTA